MTMRSVKMSCKDVILGPCATSTGKEISAPKPYDVLLKFYPIRNLTICDNGIYFINEGNYGCMNKDCPFNVFGEGEGK